MAGEGYNVGYYGNPYMQQYIAANAAIPAIQQQAAAYGYANPAFGRAIDNDRFERSSGPGLGTAVTLAGLGGAAGAGTGYFLLSNPLEKAEDGTYKLKEGFLKSYDEVKLNEYTQQMINKRKVNALSSLGITDIKQYEAVENLAKAEKIGDLAEDVRKNLPKEIQTPEAARKLVEKAEPKLAKINTAAIAENAKKNFMQQFAAETINTRLKNLTAIEKQVTELGKNATPQQIKDLLTKNKELFGIENPKKLNQYLSKIEKMSQEELLKEIQSQKSNFSYVLEHMKGNFVKNVNKETGKLIEAASQEAKNMTKNFQWSQAKRFGKWGALIGGGIGILAMMFGGSDRQA